MRTDSQSVFTGFSQDSSFVDGALIDALTLDPGNTNFDEDEEENVDLPKHACRYINIRVVYLDVYPCAFRYCGYHEPCSVALCNVCNKWFCNGKGNTAASHVVTHMVRSGHRELSLHREGPLGDATLECNSEF